MWWLNQVSLARGPRYEERVRVVREQPRQTDLGRRRSEGRGRRDDGGVLGHPVVASLVDLLTDGLRAGAGHGRAG